MKKGETVKKKGLTKVEMVLVVASAVVFLSIVVVLFCQTKVVEKSRNATRLADLSSVSTAVSLYLADNHDFSGLKTGEIYASTVGGKNVKKNDGTGWIPLNFTQIASGVPISALPIDPKNDQSDGLYYRFGVNVQAKTYEIDCAYEETGGANQQTADGGNNPSRFELGTDLSILP